MRVAIGVFAHNEGASLRNAVESVLDQPMGHVGHELDLETTSVTIVSCESHDDTDAIASELSRRDPRVRLLVRSKRHGKARAINEFLEHATAGADFVVLIGGDVVLSHGGLASLLLPFSDPTVGMTGGRPVPQNDRRGVGMLVHILWALHHRVARDTPKLGEAIAVRAPVNPLPDWTRADEACLESDVIRRQKLRLRYCPEAVVHNRGPETLRDYLSHRRRIARGHSEVASDGYRPATRRLGAVMLHVLAHAAENPREIGWLTLAAASEAFAWMLGYLDARLSRERSGVWKPIESAKREVRREVSSRSASQVASP